jgi:tartrate-resistant acid phosphatase type 5
MHLIRLNLRKILSFLSIMLVLGTLTLSSNVNGATTTTTVRFAIITDYGTDNGNELKVANMVKGWNPDFIITLGDNNALGSGGWSRAIGKYYGTYVSTGRFYPSIGNHDSDAGISGYTAYFTLPGNERYYDFVKGPIHFYAINSVNEPDGTSSTSKQANWLKGKLTTSTSTWDLVYFHYPPYTSNSVHSSTTGMRWDFKNWGADIILNGHVHEYERLQENGLTYITGLPGGQGPYSFSKTISGSQFRYSGSYGAMLVTATYSQITFAEYTTSGKLVECYKIIK